MTAAELVSTLPAMARLNNWCRVPFDQKLGMHDAERWIYAYKRFVIGAAIRLGMAALRLVAVERPCKTCKGTGLYEWVNWHDEDDVRFEDCRRCGATGKVLLRFVQSTIDGIRWHTPRPRWDLGVFTEAEWEALSSTTTDWEPEQPGQPMERLDLIRALNEVERTLYAGRLIRRRFGSGYYSLDLGKILDCAFCGAPCSGHYPECTWRIVRPGMLFERAVCTRCHDRAAWRDWPLVWPANLHWPRERDNFPEWSDRCPLPPIARDPAVTEWLGRRGIVEGLLPVGEHGVVSGMGLFVEIVGLDGNKAIYTVADNQHWAYGLKGLTFHAPASSIWGRVMRLLPAPTEVAA